MLNYERNIIEKFTKPMTDKQYKFITDLHNSISDGAPDIIMRAVIAKRDKISTRLASKIIDHLKHAVKHIRIAERIFAAGGCGSAYLAAHGFKDDYYGHKLVAEINAL